MKCPLHPSAQEWFEALEQLLGCELVPLANPAYHFLVRQRHTHSPTEAGTVPNLVQIEKVRKTAQGFLRESRTYVPAAPRRVEPCACPLPSLPSPLRS